MVGTQWPSKLGTQTAVSEHASRSDQSSSNSSCARSAAGNLLSIASTARGLEVAGSVSVYAFLINKPRNEYNAIIWLDRVTSPQYLLS
jgi:hypothetical protein